MATKKAFLLGASVLFFVGCVKSASTTQVVCTRPLINEKRVLMTVAPNTVSGEESNRFAGAVEAAVQTYLRGRGAHTVEGSPYDFYVFAAVSESGDSPLGVATVTLKMITAESEVVANGLGTAVYSGGALNGARSDVEAAGRAAQLAAENLCMTREREYIYVPQAAPYAYDAYDGYAYGYVEIYPAPFYWGPLHIRSAPRVRHRHHHHYHGRFRGGHPRR